MYNQIIKKYRLLAFILIVALMLISCNDSSTKVNDITAENESEMATEEIENDIIKIRVSEFPPFYYTNENKWTGLEVELANALIKEAGFIPEYVSLPWSRALKSMEIGEIDLMMNLVKSPEREVYMHFTGPVRSSRMTLVVHEEYENEMIETIDDLFDVSEALGLPIGLQKDVKYPIELALKLEDEAYSKYMDFTNTTKMYPSNVIEKRLFGFVEDEIAMKYQLDNNPDYAGLVIHSFLFSEDDVYIGISKELDKVKYDKLSAAFYTLKTRGDFNQIIEKYQ